jgi:hypothetical protein
MMELPRAPMRRGLEDSNDYHEVRGGPGGGFALFHTCDSVL